MTRTLLVATRNDHKLGEIRELIAGTEIRIVGPDEAGIPPDSAEQEVEAHDSFEENALAKARLFRLRSGLPTIADDSGLCVDALGGDPGVRSRRFAPEELRRERTEDAANNAWLLERLRNVPDDRRGARYLCALALVDASATLVVVGRVEGRIARAERGRGGFGYDPLFLLPERDRTYGELPPEAKARTSHRADAVRRLRPWLERWPD
ncbi:MAG: non-canonical purine NTP pyrophosphatase [Gemmatimonadota bacterium]